MTIKLPEIRAVRSVRHPGHMFLLGQHLPHIVRWGNRRWMCETIDTMPGFGDTWREAYDQWKRCNLPAYTYQWHTTPAQPGQVIYFNDPKPTLWQRAMSWLDRFAGER